MGKPLKGLLILFSVLLLSGCWDGSQLDNRSFVTAMSMDIEPEGSYLVSLEIPKVSRDTSDMEKIVKSNTHRSLNKAMYGADNYTDKEIFMGHMKMILCGEELLKDKEMFKHALDSLIRDRSISRTLLVLAAESKALDVIEADIEDETLMGVYISSFFKKKNPTSLNRQTLDNLTKYFAEGKTAMIPRVEVSDEGLKFSGAAVMKDFTLAGWLTEDELRGLTWLTEKAGLENREFNIHDEYEYFSINIEKYKSALNFFDIDGEVYAVISIKLEGDIEEAPITVNMDTNSLIHKVKKNIKDDIGKAYEALYIKMSVDGFNIRQLLEKKNPELYRIYIEDKGKSIMDIQVLLGVNVIINSNGAAED